ncbi:MAG: 4Fe-4S dicluster domain-containing protein [Myxococcales bacterium FL481]|nr:MAG: 4Fe-4S dicluster domain-containing protein [Myxococcales bacterium FL481]
MTRRGLFAGLRQRVQAPPPSRGEAQSRAVPLIGSTGAAPSPGGAALAKRHPVPVLRPPHAVAEEAFLRGCTRCFDCGEACPHGAIQLAGPRFRGAAGTPMIDTARAACQLCPDKPCVQACKPGVLRGDVPVAMGTARIDPMACLAHRGSFCSTCAERCPQPGAIVVRDGRPVVAADGCVGCGVCQHVCPAPYNAVVLVPALTRPSAVNETDAGHG